MVLGVHPSLENVQDLPISPIYQPREQQCQHLALCVEPSFEFVIVELRHLILLSRRLQFLFPICQRAFFTRHLHILMQRIAHPYLLDDHKA